MEVCLVLIKDGGERRVFPLNTGITIIGRRPNCDLRVPVMEVSRRHCEIDCHESIINLRDLGSSNGTFVNGERVQEKQLRSGDKIQVGPLAFTLEISGQVPKTPEVPAAQPAQSQPAKPAKQISDEDFFADIGLIEDLKSGSATEFPSESDH